MLLNSMKGERAQSNAVLWKQALAEYNIALKGLQLAYGSDSDHPSVASLQSKIKKLQQYSSGVT
jgi:ppGpp synthetase/RelA/SpoT-type nucleotidyltranferase